jgi:hypothetical protein
MNTQDTSSKVSTKLETTRTLTPTSTELETTRTLTPQWKGAGNLGEFQVKTVTPSIEEFNEIAQEFPEAIQEFLAGQLHIKFSGPNLVAGIREELESRHGKPEKGKSEEWHKLHASEAKALASVYASETIDFGVELRTWASAWKPEGASVSAAQKVAAVKDAAAEALSEALGITLEQAQAMLAAKMSK